MVRQLEYSQYLMLHLFFFFFFLLLTALCSTVIDYSSYPMESSEFRCIKLLYKLQPYRTEETKSK